MTRAEFDAELLKRVYGGIRLNERLFRRAFYGTFDRPDPRDPDYLATRMDPIPNPAYGRLRRVRHTCGQVVEQAWSETANGHWRCIDDHGAVLHDCPRCGRMLTRGKLQVVADYIAPGEGDDGDA